MATFTSLPKANTIPELRRGIRYSIAATPHLTFAAAFAWSAECGSSSPRSRGLAKGDLDAADEPTAFDHARPSFCASGADAAAHLTWLQTILCTMRVEMRTTYQQKGELRGL